MVFTLLEVKRDVIGTLTTMMYGVESENSVGFFDSNRAAQDFFVGFFKLLHGYGSLIEMDIAHDTTSFPAVDIGDETAGIAIQVTSRTDREKVLHTLETFISNGLQCTYPRLVICMLGKKENYRNDIDVSDAMEFSIDKDIWDIPQIIAEIKKLDLDPLSAVKGYLAKYLRSIEKNKLYDQDISDAIELLSKHVYEVVEKLELQYSQMRLPNRKEGFIEAKNKLNNLTWDDFKVIQGHLSHNERFTNFLTNPNNDKIADEYLNLANTLQNHYVNHRDEYNSIDSFMRYVFGILDTYDSELDSNKIKIVLHNMYFNCDIGDNPSEA